MRRSPREVAGPTHKFELCVMPMNPDCSRAWVRGNPTNEMRRVSALENVRRVLMISRFSAPAQRILEPNGELAGRAIALDARRRGSIIDLQLGDLVLVVDPELQGPCRPSHALNGP